MLKQLFLIFLCATITCCNDKKTADPFVYITETGSKYHESNCRYLGSSLLPISLTIACRDGYGPCSSCTPPSCATSSEEKETMASDQQMHQPVAQKDAVRCSGTTKAGKQCKRKTKDADGRCFQHKK